MDDDFPDDDDILVVENPSEEETPPTPLRIVEALLFVGGAPLSAARAGNIIRGLTPDAFHQILDELNRTYRRQNRPYSIEPRGQGFLLALKPRHRVVASRLQGGLKEARLSPQAIDVLALVAYRQPIVKNEIDTLRGADSGSMLRQLLRRGLIRLTRPDETAGKEPAYATTPRFLEVFGLSSLEDLPRTQDPQQI